MGGVVANVVQVGFVHMDDVGGQVAVAAVLTNIGKPWCRRVESLYMMRILRRR